MPVDHVHPRNSDLHYGEHLGDGVYAYRDSFQVWLTVNSHENRPLVALDARVIANLVDYAKRVGVIGGDPRG